MSENSKLKVEIEVPKHGWTHVKLSTDDSFYHFFPSYVPIDSISELVNATLEILSGNNEARVYWNDEPVKHQFLFTSEDELCNFRVFEIVESVIEKNLQERFNFKGNKYEVLRPFWKALSEMRSKQSLEDYEKHWKNPFPINEILEIKQKLKGLKK